MSSEPTEGGVEDAAPETLPPEDSQDTQVGVTDNNSGDGDATPPEPPADRAILERVAKEAGIDQRSKFRTDADFIKHYKELHGKLNERDQDAALGRVFKEHEAEFREYLSAKRTPQEGNGKPEKASSQKTVSPEEYYLLQARVLDPKTGEVRAEAPPDDVRKYREAHTALERNIVAMGLQTKQAIAASVEEILAERERQWQERAAQEQARSVDNQRVQGFFKENSGWLYADGESQTSGFKPEGQRFMEIAEGIYNEAAEMGEKLPVHRVLQIAKLRHMEEQAHAPERSGVKPQGRRKPSTLSREEAIEARVDKMIADGKSMAEVTAFLASQEA